jgi:hypothetical protein
VTASLIHCDCNIESKASQLNPIPWNAEISGARVRIIWRMNVNPPRDSLRQHPKSVDETESRSTQRPYRSICRRDPAVSDCRPGAVETAEKIENGQANADAASSSPWMGWLAD